MKTAIIGSRDITDLAIELPFRPTEIISGGAKGVDTLAEIFAKKNNIPIRVFRPDYSKGNYKAAPLIRNRLIVDNCDVLVAYWDGESKGTKFTIDYAKKQGKNVIVNILNRR